MLHPDARISATTKVQIQSHPGERWTVSCCALNKRDGRSLTKMGELARALMAAETSGISTYLYQTPVQFRCNGILYKLTLVPQSGWPFRTSLGAFLAA